MKFLSIPLILLSMLFSCNSSSQQQALLLAPSDFENKLKTFKEYQLIDVRTSEEFSEKRLTNAVNMDHYDVRFMEHAALLDKTKPVFVYCLVGGRSKEAVKNLQKAGFIEIYELKGGVMAWEKEGKNLERANTAEMGMALEELEKILETDKLVLIDFNAKWCVPCRKMAPFLKKLEEENQDLLVLPIDADKNKLLTEKYQVESLPFLILYKNNQVLWQHNGFIDEAGLMEIINKHK